MKQIKGLPSRWWSPTTKEEEENLKIFNNELLGGSPRATVLSGHIYIHALLRQLLLKRLIVNEKELKDEIEEKQGYSACVKLCYMTGVITRKEKNELVTINKIRRIFAHEITLMDFNDPEVKKHSARLINVWPKKFDGFIKIKPNGRQTPREIYLAAITWFIIVLQPRINSIEKIDAVVPFKNPQINWKI